MESLFIDPELNQRGLFSTKNSFAFPLISQRTIKVVATNVELIWVMKNFKKVISPLEIIDNAKNVFNSESVQNENSKWMPQLASSLRELCDNNFERDAISVLAKVPRRGIVPSDGQMWTDLQLYKSFLNDYAHYSQSATSLAQQILADGSVTQVTPHQFDRICCGYVDKLYAIFTHKK